MNNSEIRAVEHIRKRYVAHETTKLDELKALNKKVRRPATVFAYIFGVLGALVLGTGMCLAMKIIGDLMLLGIAVGSVGILAVSVNYAMYQTILKAREKKYAPQILDISDELLHK